MPGDSNVQAISNVQRIQQRLWLIILFPLPSPADFVQVFYGYLEDLENRQREDFANFFCLGLWIPYTDGGQPLRRAAPGYTASNLQKEKRRETLSSPTTLPVMCLSLANEDSMATQGGKMRKEFHEQLEKIYLFEVLLSIYQEIKNAEQNDDFWTNVLLSKTYYLKFQLLFHVYIKITSSPKLTKIGTLKIWVNPLTYYTAVLEKKTGLLFKSKLSNMVATGHKWTLNTWSVASPNWDVLQEYKRHWILKTQYEKKNVKCLHKYSYRAHIFIFIICGNDHFWLG